MSMSDEQRPSGDVESLAHVITRAARFANDPRALDSGERAALSRLDPDQPRPSQLAALTRALVMSGLSPDDWGQGAWRRWALVAQGIALAGHDGSRPFGAALAAAAVSEGRVTRLLTARGDALRQIVPRIVRLMASRGVSPDWREFAELILTDGTDSAAAERCRLRIASRYYSALARATQD